MIVQLPVVVCVPREVRTSLHPSGKLLLIGFFLVDGVEELVPGVYNNAPLTAFTSHPDLCNVVGLNGEVSLIIGAVLPEKYELHGHCDWEDVFSARLHCLVTRRSTGSDRWEYLPEDHSSDKDPGDEPVRQMSGLPLNAICQHLDVPLVRYRHWIASGHRYTRLEFLGFKRRILDPYEFMGNLAVDIAAAGASER